MLLATPTVPVSNQVPRSPFFLSFVIVSESNSSVCLYQVVGLCFCTTALGAHVCQTRPRLYLGLENEGCIGKSHFKGLIGIDC